MKRRPLRIRHNALTAALRSIAGLPPSQHAGQSPAARFPGLAPASLVSPAQQQAGTPAGQQAAQQAIPPASPNRTLPIYNNDSLERVDELTALSLLRSGGATMLSAGQLAAVTKVINEKTAEAARLAAEVEELRGPPGQHKPDGTALVNDDIQ